MLNSGSAERALDDRIGDRLRGLRLQKGWSLDDLAETCGVSRASLSRLEKGEVSPTTTVLWKLCSVYSLTMSRLMAMVEADFAPFVPRHEQRLWEDPANGFKRRSVSPPAARLSAEVLECELPSGTSIEYTAPPHPGLEHHLYLLQGKLALTIEGQHYRLGEGDCLRYQLFGPSRFATGTEQSAKYLLAIL